jgi:hypothetical protein
MPGVRPTASRRTQFLPATAVDRYATVPRYSQEPEPAAPPPPPSYLMSNATRDPLRIRLARKKERKSLTVTGRCTKRWRKRYHRNHRHHHHVHGHVSSISSATLDRGLCPLPMCLFARVVTINTRESALTKKIDFRHSKGAYRFALNARSGHDQIYGSSR